MKAIVLFPNPRQLILPALSCRTVLFDESILTK